MHGMKSTYQTLWVREISLRDVIDVGPSASLVLFQEWKQEDRFHRASECGET